MQFHLSSINSILQGALCSTMSEKGSSYAADTNLAAAVNNSEMPYHKICNTEQEAACAYEAIDDERYK